MHKNSPTKLVIKLYLWNLPFISFHKKLLIYHSARMKHLQWPVITQRVSLVLYVICRCLFIVRLQANVEMIAYESRETDVDLHSVSKLISRNSCRADFSSRWITRRYFYRVPLRIATYRRGSLSSLI